MHIHGKCFFSSRPGLRERETVEVQNYTKAMGDAVSSINQRPFEERKVSKFLESELIKEQGRLASQWSEKAPLHLPLNLQGRHV